MNLGVNANASSLVGDGSSLFLGTDHGVFQSNDAGETWIAASKGLNPSAVVTVLSLNGAELVASISDDGLWKRPRSDLPSPILPTQWGRAGLGFGLSPISHFRPGAAVKFTIPLPGFVTLSVYDLKGQKAATLVSGNLSQGVHHAGFNGPRLAPGVYFLRLSAPGFSETSRFYFNR